MISLAAATSCQDEGVHVTLVAEGDATLQLTAIDVKAEDAGGKARTHRFEINGANSTLPLTLGLTFTDEARYPIQLFLTASSQRGVVATAETQLTQRREGETRITLRLRCTEADCRETPAPPAPPPPAPPPPDAGGVEPPPDASDPPPEVKPPPPDAGGDEPPVVMPPPPPPLSCHQPHTDETACDDGDACTNDVRVPTTCGSTCVYRSAAKVGAQDGCCPIGATAASDGDCSPIERAPRTCLEIAQSRAKAPSGLYEIDFEGKPWVVYCDLRSQGTDRDGRGWTRVFRHVLPKTKEGACTDRVQAYFDDDKEAQEAHRKDPFAPKYSVLSSLEHFRRGERLEFRLVWPGLPRRNVWSQLSNPTRLENVNGYKPIAIEAQSNAWGGLERSTVGGGGESSFIDGSVNSPMFFYAIGAKRPWSGSLSGTGFPSWEGLEGACEVELWVR